MFVFVWWTCDDFARVRRSTGGVPALSEPDFGVLLEHIMSFGTVCGLLVDSKYLSQFCLVNFEFLATLFFGIIIILFITTQSSNVVWRLYLTTRTAHSILFGFYMSYILVQKII